VYLLTLTYFGRQNVKKMIHIRLATPKDALVLSQLICENAKVTLAAHYTELQLSTFLRYYDETTLYQKITSQYMLCAIIDQEIVGTAALDQSDYLVGFYTSKSHFCKGIASLLLEAIEKEAVVRGKETLYLAASPVAVSYYLKQGWELTGLMIFQYLGIDFEETLMQKGLV
jgi:GNAT superfamily N-acetyltransferase